MRFHLQEGKRANTETYEAIANCFAKIGHIGDSEALRNVLSHLLVWIKLGV